MNENERSALAEYRASLGAKQPDAARDWSRLVGKIESGAQPMSVELEPPRRRRWAAWGVGAAAAVLLAVWAWPKFEPARGEDTAGVSQAAYEAEQRGTSAVVRPQPEPLRRMEPAPRPPAPDVPPEPIQDAEPEPRVKPEPQVPPESPPKPRANPAKGGEETSRPERDTKSEVQEPDVVAEAKALREARAALRDQNPSDALRRLRRYLSRFPQGVLRDEATLLRADALCMDGQREKSRDVAAHLVRTHPKSPLAARARAVCREP